MDMDIRASLETLSLAIGVGGLTDASDKAELMLKEYCEEIERDALGSVIGWRRCGQKNAPVILLEAHIDEIGLVVTGVDDHGFIRADACGGVDRRALSGAEVVVFGDRPYAGVFCSTPPHLKGDEKSALQEIADMGIDVGLDAKKAKKRIHPGDRIAFRSAFCRVGKHCVSGKSLDDRAGVAAVLRCMDLLKNEDISCDVAVVFAVQEELGCRGSAVTAFHVAPDAAIAVDVSFAFTPDAVRHKCGALGKGPMIGWAPGLDDRMTRQLEALAKEENIPTQQEVMGGDTGTDADSIMDARAGVRTALLSIPLRYMHTPVETIDLRDVENTARLMAAFVRKEASSL